MKTLTKKIVSVMMAATCLGAAPVVLPEALKPAAITASAYDLYDTGYYHYTIPVYGYNYGWYPHTGTNNYDIIHFYHHINYIMIVLFFYIFFNFLVVTLRVGYYIEKS